MTHPDLEAILPSFDLPTNLIQSCSDVTPGTEVSTSTDNLLFNSAINTILPPATALDDVVQPTDSFDIPSMLLTPQITDNSGSGTTSSSDLSLVNTSPQVSSILERALELPNRASWIRDFLFADAPAVDLAMLTSPPALESAITATVSENCMEFSGAHNGTMDTRMSLQWTLIPSYCTGNILCGAASIAMQFEGGCAKPAPREVCFGRFIRDERTSEFLLFRQHAPVEKFGPTSSLLHMALTNSTTRHRSFIRFTKTPAGRTPDASSAVFMNVSTENRLCPACGSGPSAGCGCVLFGRTPAHPLDFADCTVMANHCGDFTGHCVLSILKGPQAPTIAHMISKSSVRGGRDRGLTTSLTGWAVRNKLALLGPNTGTAYTALTPQENRILDEVREGKRPHTCNATTINKKITSVTPFAPYVQGGAMIPAIEKLPMSLPMPVNTTSSTSNSEEEKAARKHRRKLRNRMAAARSNLKRKENYINLQKNVTEIRETKLRLTKQLENLREENFRLRTLLQHE